MTYNGIYKSAVFGTLKHSYRTVQRVQCQKAFTERHY